MNIIFAKHKGCDKEFIFEVPDNMLPEKGDILWVDTCRGNDVAVATTGTISGRNIEQIIEKYGAYFPLKQVKTYANIQLINFIKTEIWHEMLDRFYDVNIPGISMPKQFLGRDELDKPVEDLPF